MAFHSTILDDLAAAGANLVIDGPGNAPRLNAIVDLWDKANGTLVIKNAGNVPPGLLISIAKRLGGRVTLEE